MVSDARIKANAKYDKEHMKQYTVKMQKELYEEIMKEVEKNNTNKNAYTIQALKEKLERDKE